MTLWSRQYKRFGLLFSIYMYLARSSAAQGCQQSISPVVAWCAHDALNHGNHTSALEQIHLSRIFLKDLCKGESFNSALALVLGRWLYGDVRGMAALALFDVEEARTPRVGWAQTQKDIEQRTRGSRRRLHVWLCLFRLWRCRPSVSQLWCTKSMWSCSCARVSVNMARTPLPWTTNAPPMTRYDAVTCDRERGCGVQPDSLLHGLVSAYPLEQKTPQISLDVFPWLLSRNMDSLPETY